MRVLQTGNQDSEGQPCSSRPHAPRIPHVTAHIVLKYFWNIPHLFLKSFIRFPIPLLPNVFPLFPACPPCNTHSSQATAHTCSLWPIPLTSDHKPWRQVCSRKTRMGANLAVLSGLLLNGYLPTCRGGLKYGPELDVILAIGEQAIGVVGTPFHTVYGWWGT